MSADDSRGGSTHFLCYKTTATFQRVHKQWILLKAWWCLCKSKIIQDPKLVNVRGVRPRGRGGTPRQIREEASAGGVSDLTPRAGAPANVRAGAAAVSWRLATRGGRAADSELQSTPDRPTSRTLSALGTSTRAINRSRRRRRALLRRRGCALESGTWSSARRPATASRTSAAASASHRRTPIVLHQVLWWWWIQALVVVHLPCRRSSSGRIRTVSGAARGECQHVVQVSSRRQRVESGGESRVNHDAGCRPLQAACSAPAARPTPHTSRHPRHPRT